MKVTIINQPLKNRGDEAAHRSLVRNLAKAIPDVQISVIFLGYDKKSINEMIVLCDNVQYVAVHETRGTYRIMRFALKFHLERLVISIVPCLREYFSFVKNADYVISAPGGICLGGFQNWGHLILLQFTKKLNKKIIYYSRSIGPFPETTNENKLFKKFSLDLLKYFSFLSVRDSKSMQLLDELKIPYFPSIDTAFLDNPDVSVPLEVKNAISENYIVFVPNSLTWHPDFKNKDQNKINNFYVKIINELIKRYPDFKIVLLPQLFYDETKSDAEYFIKLSKLITSENLICLPETICSDIQQKIISKSKFVIGSRYHSIVFSINSEVPFISLSYEHKMTGLLELLSLSNRSIDILSIGEENFEEDKILKSIDEILDLPYEGIEPKIKARKMATDCFQQMIKMLKND